MSLCLSFFVICLCVGKGGGVRQKLTAKTTEGDPGGQEAHFTAAGAAQQSSITGEARRHTHTHTHTHVLNFCLCIIYVL